MNENNLVSHNCYNIYQFLKILLRNKLPFNAKWLRLFEEKKFIIFHHINVLAYSSMFIKREGKEEGEKKLFSLFGFEIRTTFLHTCFALLFFSHSRSIFYTFSFCLLASAVPSLEYVYTKCVYARMMKNQPFVPQKLTPPFSSSAGFIFFYFFE